MVEFVWHDCFVVKSDSVNMVFDYWLDKDGENREFPDFLSELDPDKPLIVFVSHGHKDHYNPAIFSWASRFSNIHYIVSKDVYKRIRHIISPSSVYSGPKVDESSVIQMRPGDDYFADSFHVRACPSTDIGNSYMVETDGQRFFHAGDLNAWIWLDESTEQEVKKALGDYKACLRDIAAYLDSAEADAWRSGAVIDYCFFPVDSRIGRDYETGAKMFLETFKVINFCPMHFDLGDDAERLERKADALKAVERSLKYKCEKVLKF